MNKSALLSGYNQSKQIYGTEIPMVD